METYNFRNHKKGQSIDGLNIVLNFELTGSQIEMNFKSEGGIKTLFSWSTKENTFLIQDYLIGDVLMIHRVLDFPRNVYNYEFKVINPLGIPTTYFGGKLKIV